MNDITERLRSSASGTIEWRVQNPETRAYCISFTEWNGGERSARQWLDEEIRARPETIFAKHEVARVAALDHRDRLMLEAADEIDRLRARVAELESQERGGWIRTSGWSNELYSFDRSDNEDGTFALTVSERDGRRLVEIDRLTASDLERIVDVVGDGVVSRPAAELEAATVFVRHDEDDAAKDGA